MHEKRFIEPLHPDDVRAALADTPPVIRAPIQSAAEEQIPSPESTQNAPLEHSSPDAPSHSTAKIDALSTIGSYLAGLFVILLISGVLTYFFKDMMISHRNEYFGDLQDAFSAVIVWPILLILFGSIAYINRDWVLFAYPFIVFLFVGPILLDLHVGKPLAMLLYSNPEQYNTAVLVFSVMLSYALVYTIERTISLCVRRGRFKDQSQNKVTIMTQISCTAIVLLLVGGYIGNISPLTSIATAQNAYRYLYAENDDLKIFRSDSNGQNGSQYIAYKHTTTQTNGTYAMRDTVENWGKTKTNDTRAACGTTVSFHDIPGQEATYTYSTTNNGTVYGTATFEQRWFKSVDDGEPWPLRYRYCLVVEGHKLIFERKTIKGEAYLERFPIDTVVDALAKAQTYRKCEKVVRYICSEQDVQLTRLAEKQPEIIGTP